MMMRETQPAQAPRGRSPDTSLLRPRLQRKCACGGTPGPSGECSACEKKRGRGQSIQTKLAINAPGDKYEQEADRMADSVMAGKEGNVERRTSNVERRIQREEKTPPPKDNYEEAKKKALDALKETPIAKQLKAKAEEMGAEFLSSVEGKVVAGTALGGALAGIIASNSEFPVGIPELPLDFIAPGLKAKITWEGPSQNPTKAGLVLTSGSGVSVGGSYTSTPASPGKPAEQTAGLSLSIPLGGSSTKKKGPSEKDKFRAETARLATEQKNIRESQKTGKERAEDKAFLDDYVRSKINDPLNPLALPGLGRPLVPEPERKWEEEGAVQRKANSESASVGSAPPIVDEVLQSSGQPLDPGTRRFMEERFGHDFSNVRVHRNDRADASARAVDALAYTVGRNIVFRGDAFAPDSIAGRRLLAHELAHVVQQGATSRTLQRAPVAGLEVKGRQTGAGGDDVWPVFFERNGSTIDTDGRLAVLLAGGGVDDKRNFDLKGYVSEDEATTPAVGKTLADKRITRVDGALKDVGHVGKRNPQPLPDVGDGRLDYRNVRSVEITKAGAKAATPNCKKTAAQGPCGGKAETEFVATRKTAQGLIDISRRLLNSGTDSATNDLRDEFFGGGGGKGSGAPVTKTLDANLGKIRAQMDRAAKRKQHRCGTLCDGTCTLAIAYNDDVGAASVLTLCPRFINAQPRERTRNFIHEIAHGTPDIGPQGKTAGTRDLAYRFERRLPRLTPDQALQNSDSYSLFVMLSADPAFSRPPRVEDKLSVKKGEQAGVQDALALLSDWMKWSTQEVGSTYATMVESRPPKTAWTNAYYEETMKLIAPHFGLTMPPALPTDDDRIAVAGISDRYRKLQNAVRQDLKVRRNPGLAKTEWPATPGDSVTLGDDFFALPGAVGRTRLLMRLLVARTADILPAHRKKFIDLAEQLNARNPLP